MIAHKSVTPVKTKYIVPGFLAALMHVQKLMSQKSGLVVYCNKTVAGLEAHHQLLIC